MFNDGDGFAVVHGSSSPAVSVPDGAALRFYGAALRFYGAPATALTRRSAFFIEIGGSENVSKRVRCDFSFEWRFRDDRMVDTG